MITFEEFTKIEMATGTIIDAKPNAKAIKPAYVLTIDFGPLGVKTSSAQITHHYTVEQLIGQQIVAVMNFAPKRVAGVNSEVLVLGVTSQEQGIVLLHPTQKVDNGMRVH